jgi:hypothetical protein
MVAATVLLMVTALAVPFAMVRAAGASDRPPGGRMDDPAVREIIIAQPAVVRIATIYYGHVSLTICGQSISLPASGPGYRVGGFGSGAFISANGDILTADHVADIDKDSLDNEIFTNPNSSQDIAAAINTICHPLLPASAADVAAGYTSLTYQTRYSEPQRLVWRSIAFSGPVPGGPNESRLNALLSVDHQEATLLGDSTFEANDLALLHVNISDTPSIPLGDSSAVAVEDHLTNIGFPGNADAISSATQYGSPTDLLTPSVNNLTVSAIKPNGNGASLIQVGGNIEHGDSGGPALDAEGKVVGIVSFGGTIDPINNFFLRSSNDVTSLLNAANINTKPGAFQTQWRQAFLDYASTKPGHWHKAAAELGALNSKYPDFHGVEVYRDYARKAAAIENTTDGASVGIFALIGVVTLGLVAGLIAVLFLALRRRRATPPALGAAGTSQPLPYGAPYPYASMPNAGVPSQGYAGPSPYGAYGPPSPYGTQNGYPSRVGAGSVPGAQSLRDAAASAPLEQMPSYPGQRGAGASYVSGVQAGGMPGGVAVGTATSPRPLSPSMPGYSSRGGYCANGHPMAPSEGYCAVCGAQRVPASMPRQ